MSSTSAREHRSSEHGVTALPMASKLRHWHSRSVRPLQLNVGIVSVKHECAHVGTAAMALVSHAVAIAVTVVEVREARRRVVDSVTPKQPQAPA
jgi:hypothetical protein